MIRIAIVEDDAGYRQTLLRYMERYKEESKQLCQVTTFEDGEDIVEDYEGRFDIILMDIEMRFMDGMTAAEHIRQRDSQVVIIFITNMPQYAMKGYAVEAMDYVLKPINYFAFSQRLDRAIARLENRRHRYISLANKKGMTRMAIDDIFYIEVVDHDLLYHTKHGVITVRGTIKDAEQTLAGEDFFRCNRCYLISLAHVDGLYDQEVVVHGERVQVSRGRRKELMEVLNRYLNEVSK